MIPLKASTLLEGSGGLQNRARKNAAKGVYPDRDPRISQRIVRRTDKIKDPKIRQTMRDKGFKFATKKTIGSLNKHYGMGKRAQRKFERTPLKPYPTQGGKLDTSDFRKLPPNHATIKASPPKKIVDPNSDEVVNLKLDQIMKKRNSQ